MNIMKILMILFLLFGGISNEIGFDLNKEQNKAADLTQEDFSVSDGVDTIILNMLWSDLTMHRELIADDGTNPMNHFVGNIYEEDNIYDVYYYIYDGITIFYSDWYSGKNKEGNCTYNVNQISITDSSFSTPRKIRIGDNKKKVIEAYGSGEISMENDSVCYSYYCGDFAIRFIFDKKIL